MNNELHYGDNLAVLRRHVLDESVDLIYLDPPFNSQRAYNVIFQDKTGREPAAQIEAFGDTWSWGEEAQDAFDELIRSPLPSDGLKQTMLAFKSVLDQTDLMAYLTMMAIRLVELQRVLKPTGSLYLHCDPTACHYLKIILDQVFDKKNFRNEIIWCYRRYTAASKRFQRMHDVVFYYGKGESVVYNDIRIPYGKKSGKLDSHYQQDEDGRWFRWQKRKEMEPYKVFLSDGVRLGDWWFIPHVNASAKERLGYPTQKPVALLERIIQSSSNPGDVVMDPFCGCGTAVVAAEKLGRQWIGIDITYLAITLIKKRLLEQFPDAKFIEHGIPRSVADAHILFGQSPIEFQKWAVSILGGQPHQRRGGGDRGIDGLLYFQDFERKYHKVIIEVKGGGYQPKDVRALKTVMDREGAPLGLLMALEVPSKGMVAEAAALGKWKLPGGQAEYPVLQIFTVEDYFAGHQVRLPDTSGTLKSAVRTLSARETTSKLEGI